ncbi:MAG: hypothetical protein JXA21_11605 [Anaerolineae bacterium]|nr:hypothetical protein [Anaerolineae bacterium]
MLISTALQKYTLLLLVVVLLTTATTCGLSWGTEQRNDSTATGTTGMEATLAALAAQNAQLATQVAALGIQTAAPTPTATPVAPTPYNPPTVRATTIASTKAVPTSTPTPLPTAVPSGPYHPIVLDPSQAKATSDLAMQPLGDVVLGGIPFHLFSAIFKSQASTPPYDHGPTEILLKQEVPYAHELHLLLNAGNGFNEFKGQVVGQVIAYCNGAPLWVADLRLGQEIREWHTGGNVVSTTTRAQQVWTAPIANMSENTGYIDMLTLALPAECRTGALTAIKIVDTSATTLGALDPALNLIGVTVSTQSPQRARPGAEAPDGNAPTNEQAAEKLRAQFEATLAQLQRPPRKNCIGYEPKDEDAQRTYEIKLTDAITGLLTHPLAQSLYMATLASMASSEEHRIEAFAGTSNALLVVTAPVGACKVGSHDPDPGFDIRVFDRTGRSWFIGRAGRMSPEGIQAFNGGWAIALDLSNTMVMSQIVYTVWHIEKNAEWEITSEFRFEDPSHEWHLPIMKVVDGQLRILITYFRWQEQPPCQFDAEVQNSYLRTRNRRQKIYAWNGESYVEQGSVIAAREIACREDNGQFAILDSWQEHCIAAEVLPNPGWTHTVFKHGVPVESPEVEYGLDTNGYDAIEDIAIAADGSPWVPMNDGMAHDDGNTWHTYTAPGGFAFSMWSAIAVGGDGAVWVGLHDHGAARFDGSTWVTYTGEDGPNEWINEIAIDPGNVVWLGTDNGIFRFENGEWTQPLHGVAIDNIIAAPDGTLWASDSETLFRFDGTWQSYPTRSIQDIAVTNNSSVWVVSIECGNRSGSCQSVLARRDAQTPDRVSQTIKNIPRDGDLGVDTIAVTPDGTLWLGSLDGAYRYDYGQWSIYNSASGLIHTQVGVIRAAPDGSIWFGTEGGISHHTP